MHVRDRVVLESAISNISIYTGCVKWEDYAYKSWATVIPIIDRAKDVRR